MDGLNEDIELTSVPVVDGTDSRKMPDLIFWMHCVSFSQRRGLMMKVELQ